MYLYYILNMSGNDDNASSLLNMIGNGNASSVFNLNSVLNNQSGLKAYGEGSISAVRVLEHNRRFIFPPTIILDVKDQQIYTEKPNLNMIIFLILIMLYDFAHDHIKSTKRINPVDKNFLKFFSQSPKYFETKKKVKGIKRKKVEGTKRKKVEDQNTFTQGNFYKVFEVDSDDEEEVDSDDDSHLGGSPQKGGNLDYVKDCFSDMKNILNFILFSIISYMDIDGIGISTGYPKESASMDIGEKEEASSSKKDTDAFTQRSLNIFFGDKKEGDTTAKQREEEPIKAESETADEQQIDENEKKLDIELEMHYFCFVVNLIFTKYTDTDTEENLTHFILENDEKDGLYVKDNSTDYDNMSSNSGSIKGTYVSAPNPSKSFPSPHEPVTEKPIDFISDNCAPNNIKLIKFSILQAVCHLHNKDKNRTLFDIRKDDNFFNIFIMFYLRQLGFGFYDAKLNDSIGSLYLTSLLNKFIPEIYNDFVQSLKKEDIDLDNGMGSGTQQKAETGENKVLTIPGSPEQKQQPIKHLSIEPQDKTHNEKADKVGHGQRGGNRDNIIKYLHEKTEGKNPSIFLNNQVFRLYVCTVLTQLGILTPVFYDEGIRERPEEFETTDFCRDLIYATRENQDPVIHVVNQIPQPPLPPQPPHPPHPTLYILSEILKQLEPVWNANPDKSRNIFSNYDSIESDFEEFFYRLSAAIPDFLGTFPLIKNNSLSDSSLGDSELSASSSSSSQASAENNNIRDAYIYSNASNVLGYNDGKEFKINYLPEHRENTDMIRKSNIIISDAAIIDAFGKTNINMNDRLELVNRNFYVQGMTNNSDLDNRFLFNGVINVENKDNKGEISNNSTVHLENYEANDASDNPLVVPFETKCRVGVQYDQPFQFDNTDIKHYKKNKIYIESKKRDKNDANVEITNTKNFVFDINDTLLSSELSNIREFMLKKLVDLIDSNNAKNKHGRRGRNFNLFQNCYIDISGIIELISITLGKTECDLLQILVTVLKDGAYDGDIADFNNSETNYISREILGYQNGNGLRVISHNDLTASIITYFMLIFGYNTWVPKADSNNYGITPYDGNTGKNDLAFLNDTRLSRFAVGNYTKLQEVFNDGSNLSFNYVQFRPTVVTNLIPGAASGVGAIDADTNAAETNASETNAAEPGAVSKSSVAFEPVGAIDAETNASEPVGATSESSVASEPVGATSEPGADYGVREISESSAASQDNTITQVNKRQRKNPVTSYYFTRYKKRGREDKTGGSKIGGTRRIKLRKKYITRKKNKILKKRTKKHYRKKYKTKRLI